MLKFRVVHLDSKRAVLSHHGEDGETAKLELCAPNGMPGDMREGMIYDLRMVPEIEEAGPPPERDGADELIEALQSELTEARARIAEIESPPPIPLTPAELDGISASAAVPGAPHPQDRGHGWEHEDEASDPATGE